MRRRTRGTGKLQRAPDALPDRPSHRSRPLHHVSATGAESYGAHQERQREHRHVRGIYNKFEIEALALVAGDVDAFHLDEGERTAAGGMHGESIGAEALISGLLNREYLVRAP
jgi:hypothetical protein